jgi:hypothetical protein
MREVFGDRARAASSSTAQRPATCGVAMDVPLMRTYRGATTHRSRSSAFARALATPMP